jgi:choline dehydrogenase-like flavoprotein
MTGLAGGDDALSRIYPLLVPATRLALSTQAQTVLDRAAQHEAELERDGIHVGRARLAIAQPTPSGQSCVYCGMCLYGCPYGLIYSTQSTLRTRLMPHEAFTYVPGVVVRKCSERGRGRVVIDAVTRDTGEPRSFEASRVYLAAGALGSTAILLESVPDPSPVVLRQSDHFLVPMLLRHFKGRVADERLHTLSQLFIEIQDRSVSPHGVHMQLYTYSDFFPRMAKETLGPFYPVVAPIVDRVLSRVVVLKGYLHSDESSAMVATLDRRAGVAALRLAAVHTPRSRQVVRAAVSRVSRNGRKIGVSPIRIAARIGRPGSGVHVGGSFPMRRSPVDFESDTLGRPIWFERVHVVDSTVFPALPAAPPTLTVMANAFRIASEVVQHLPVD